MKFKYKVLTKDGKVEEGTMDAPNRAELGKRFKKAKKTIIFAEEEKGHHINIKELQIFNFITLKDKINFARNLSAMIKAGFSISKALSVLSRQTKNKKLQNILHEINSSVEQGSTLSEALSKHPKTFSSLFISMVHAGEESGKLAESLLVVSGQMEQMYQLSRRVRGAMMYPAIIVCAMILIGVLMMMFVVPTLTDTFRDLDADLPRSTQFIISVSDFLKNNTIIAIVLIVAFVFSFIYGIRTKIGKQWFEWTILHIPIIKGLVQKTNAARTTRTLASLLVSGVEVVEAIKITGEVVQNGYFRSVLIRARENIQKGKPISEVFFENDRLYPVLVGEMIAVGEETGQLPDMLIQVAEFYEDEVEQQTKDLSTVIEPFLMIVIGAAVGFFAVSMIQPIYSLSTGI